jgi:lysophospholipid acyltransferase
MEKLNGTINHLFYFVYILILISLLYLSFVLFFCRNRYQNVNFLAIETTCDFRTIIGEWNVSTNQWLNQYIYQRLGKTFYANLVTYLVSAFWHGFYPGYYMTFVTGALYTALTRLIYKSFVWPWKQKYRRVLLYCPNYLLVNYFAAPFALQTFQDSWKFCMAWKFYGHLIMFLAFALLILASKIKGGFKAKDKGKRKIK